MPDENPLPCSHWCPFLACDGCPYQGGTTPNHDDEENES